MTNLEQMEAKFKSIGLPYHDLRVFGTLRCNVHVRCVGRTTADKWAHVLNTVFPKVPIRMVPTMWPAVENKGTCLLPTQVRGYLVAVMA